MKLCVPASATIEPTSAAARDHGAYSGIEAVLRLPRLDAAQRYQLARAYAAIGLGLPAAELLRDTVDEAADESCAAAAPVENRCDKDETRALARAAAARSGRQTWGRRAERFESNLRAMAQRGINIEAIRRAWQHTQANWQLFVDRHGVDHVRTRIAADGWRWWPSFANHAAAAAAAPPPADSGQLMPGPYLFRGIGEGSHFERIWRESRNTFLGYDSAIYTLVSDMELLAVALHLHDWTTLLADPAVFFFVGPQAEEALRRVLLEQPNFALPRYVFSSGSGNDAELIESVAAARGQAADASLRSVESLYQSCDRNYWGERFAAALAGRDAPLRILATVSTHTSFLQYSMNDALAALRRLGCETRLITEQASHEIVGVATYHRHIADFRPDLFLAIDHLRSSFAGKLPTNLPLMTWDQDALTHLFNEANIRRMGPLDTVVGLPQFELIARCGADPRAFLTAHMATSPDRFELGEISDQELAPYRCDVAYVSHASQTAEEFHKAECAGYADPNARRLLEAIFPIAIARVRSHGSVQGGQMREILDEAQRRSGVSVVDPAVRHRLIGWHIWRLCDRAFRHQALEWVADWAQRAGRSFRIYGNGWERHPTLAAYAAGPAANGRELALVYRASAVNLQLMPAGFLHQRSLDGILSGGFFLARETTADQRDPRLAPLWQDIQKRKLASAAAIRSSRDAALIAAFESVRISVGHDQQEAEKTYQFLRSDAQWDYPFEVLPGFDRITFRDAATFVERVEAFLRSPGERAAITAQLRETVIARYSYDVTMQKFLRFAAAYFAETPC